MYNLILVITSFLVASIAALSIISLMEKLEGENSLKNKYWIMGGAFTLGLGIWSMHYIGTLAMNNTYQVTLNEQKNPIIGVAT